MAELCPGVIFDLDGTLIDSNSLHALAWSRALRGAGEWAPMYELQRLIGMGADQLLPRVIGRTDDDVAASRDAEYAALVDEVVAFPGAQDLLRAVRGMGLKVVLGTSSAPAELDKVIGLIGGPDVIDARTTIDDVHRSKPDPEIFRRAVEIGHLDRARTVVVGDSVWDIEAATSAGLPCVAVESGGSRRSELHAAGAIEVVRDVAQLHDFLHFSAIGRLSRR